MKILVASLALLAACTYPQTPVETTVEPWRANLPAARVAWAGLSASSKETICGMSPDLSYALLIDQDMTPDQADALLYVITQECGS